MSEKKRNDLIADVADALTLDHDVQWDRCAKLATPADRETLENLRVIARVFKSRRHVGTTSAALPLTSPHPRAGAFMGRVLRTLMVIAAVEVVVGLVLLPWAWTDYHRQHGDLAVYFVVLFAGHCASASLLLFAGVRESRTWLLGGVFLVRAALGPFHMLPAFLGILPPPHMVEAFLREPPLTMGIFSLLYLPAFHFAPAFLWAFARECPRVHRRTRLDDLARRMVPVSVAVGIAVWVAYVATLGFARAGYAKATVSLVVDRSFAVTDLLALAAAAVIVLRARSAPADEVRRVVVFGAGFVIYVGLSVAANLAEVFSPGMWMSKFQWSPLVLVVVLMRFPGMILLWYSVLAVRVPHPKEVVRASYRRLLMRPGLLGAATAVPAAALAWMVASHPERTVGAVIKDPLAQLLFAAGGIMLLAVINRQRILIRLDTWIFPETKDQRHELAVAGAALAQAGRMTAVSRTVTRAVKRGSGSPAILLIATDTAAETPEFRAPDAKNVPLPRASAIVHLLETAGGPLRVNPKDKTSVYPLLPPEDAAWVAESCADVILPLSGPGAEVFGMLVVGRRFDERIVRIVDLPFLEALGAAAGLAVARLRLLEAPDARPSEAPPAQECPVCRRVVVAGAPPECECGVAYRETEVPKLLSGKFRLTRRLGVGGMGAVYLARDLQLARDVAIKILGKTSADHLIRLRPEAQAMATVTHPAAAQIYGVESWRDRPFLIVEFLPGGTLEDRLRDGPVPPLEAVSGITRLADALAVLHEKGFLHGDIKPSNIGITSNGSPKLLDFGLARETDDTVTAGGTLRYMSPEVLSGRPADEADDVWSLCVVLYEMVSGRHPFDAPDIDETVGRIRHRRLTGAAGPSAGSKTESAVIGFAASILRAPRSARPVNARAFAEAFSIIFRADKAKGRDQGRSRRAAHH